jgi:hypothetical protein
VIASRFTEAEAEEIDRMRGALSRAEWIRLLFVRARTPDTPIRSDVALQD